MSHSPELIQMPQVPSAYLMASAALRAKGQSLLCVVATGTDTPPTGRCQCRWLRVVRGHDCRYRRNHDPAPRGSVRPRRQVSLVRAVHESSC